jgi:vacuolar iron transporter family protein
MITDPVDNSVVQAAFAGGAAIPTLAMLLPSHPARFWGNIGATTAGLILFGSLGAWLGAFSLCKGASRVLMGGWIAIAITYGVGKAFGANISG